MLCFYHSADFDGICSGAIVKRKFSDCYVYGINHGQDFPWDMIQEGETVVMCDYSLNGEDMEKLNKLTDFIWIDHHSSAINTVKNTGLEIEGLREVGKAACELTWEYYYPDKPIPRTVKYLGRYDVWDFSNEDVEKFQYGMRTIPSDITRPYRIDEFWESMFDDTNEYIDEIIDMGKVVLLYTKSEYERYIRSYGFVTKFEGMRTLACNRGMTGSKLFNSIYKQDELYDIMLAFVKLSHDPYMWTVSIYTESDDIDCSVIAKKYGGGGHQKAAGFQCDTVFLLENILYEARPRDKKRGE
jgi:oligoribonuclease NrnB/cAMP/cGMP phosphodiesterase (DHH superfamily)